MWQLTRNGQTLTVCGLLTGITFIAVGAHLSYKDIDRQRARDQARKEFLEAHFKARLRKLLGD